MSVVCFCNMVQQIACQAILLTMASDYGLGMSLEAERAHSYGADARYCNVLEYWGRRGMSLPIIKIQMHMPFIANGTCQSTCPGLVFRTQVRIDLPDLIHQLVCAVHHDIAYLDSLFTAENHIGRDGRAIRVGAYGKTFDTGV